MKLSFGVLVYVWWSEFSVVRHISLHCTTQILLLQHKSSGDERGMQATADGESQFTHVPHPVLYSPPTCEKAGLFAATLNCIVEGYRVDVRV